MEIVTFLKEYYWLLIIIVPSGILLIIAILKYIKGTLKIEVDKIDYKEGETIKGQIKFKAKKEIKSNELSIEIVRQEFSGYGLNKTWIDKNDKNKVILQHNIKYTPGYENIINFEIKIPINNKNLEKFYSREGKLFENAIRWIIRAKDDCEGLDLHSEDIEILVSKNNKIKKDLDENDEEFKDF